MLPGFARAGALPANVPHMASPNGSRRSSLRALRHLNFALFFSGNLLSNCGTWFQNIALALLVYRLTGSSFWVGAARRPSCSSAFPIRSEDA